MWRMAPLVEPTVGGRFSYYNSLQLEGRGNPPPFPIRTRYSGFRFSENARYPASESFTLTADLAQFRDTLDQVSADFEIYDVVGSSALVGGEYVPAPNVTLAAQGGAAWFHSSSDRPVGRDQVALVKSQASYTDPELGFGGRVGFDRGYLLGRSLRGAFDSEIFAEDRLFVGFDQRLGDRFDARGGGSYLRYSGGTERAEALAALDFHYRHFVLTGSGSFAPLQTRFLTDDDRLEFVDVASAGASGAFRPIDPIEFAGEYRYSDFSDQNHLNFSKVLVSYYVPRFDPFPAGFERRPSPYGTPGLADPLSVGLEYSIHDFGRVSENYNSFDLRALKPFVRLRGSIVPRLDFDLGYAHAFLNDDPGRPYDGDEGFWVLEYFCNLRFRLGAEGHVGFNDLPERSQKYTLYVRAIF
jgi:hypothetical protein